MGLRSERDDVRTVVLVEGVSDQIALETLAGRRGIDLAEARVRVVPLGGAHGVARFLEELGARHDDLTLAGLCDAAEAPVFREALEGMGLGSDLSREEMEQLGFYVCVADLEDELIRALGVPAVKEILRAHGDLMRFRKLQRMPAWRGRATDEQLRRFIAAGARRKIRYARLFVDALDLERVPRPLDGVVAHAVGRDGG